MSPFHLNAPSSVSLQIRIAHLVISSPLFASEGVCLSSAREGTLNRSGSWISTWRAPSVFTAVLSPDWAPPPLPPTPPPPFQLVSGVKQATALLRPALPNLFVALQW